MATSYWAIQIERSLRNWHFIASARFIRPGAYVDELSLPEMETIEVPTKGHVPCPESDSAARIPHFDIACDPRSGVARVGEH